MSTSVSNQVVKRKFEGKCTYWVRVIFLLRVLGILKHVPGGITFQVGQKIYIICYMPSDIGNQKAFGTTSSAFLW